MTEEKLKSAYELAMEKLRARDREKGVGPEVALTEKQKGAIADARALATAKLAEIEILWQSRRDALRPDPEAWAKAEQEYLSDRARIMERTESEVETIRKG